MTMERFGEMTISEVIKACRVSEPLTNPEEAKGTETYQNWEMLKQQFKRREKEFYDKITPIPTTGIFSKMRVPLVDFWEEIFYEETLTKQETQIVEEIRSQIQKEKWQTPEYQERIENFLKELEEEPLEFQEED